MSPRKVAPGRGIAPLIVRVPADVIESIQVQRARLDADRLEERASHWVSRAKAAQREGRPLAAESSLDRAAEALSAAKRR